MSLRKDIHNNIIAVTALYPRSIAVNGTTAGEIIDTKGCRSIEFIIPAGTISDGTYMPLIEEGDAPNLSDAVAIVARNLLGTIAEATHSVGTTLKTLKIGVSLGDKRYVRFSLVSSAVTAGAVIGASAILGTPQLVPTISDVKMEDSAPANKMLEASENKQKNKGKT